MRVSLAKWGNSLAVRIPKAVADSARLREGQDMDIAASKAGDILLRRRKNLRELVNAITPKNRHAATDWGPPVGKEVW
jgi:antitoxin MazE